MVIKKTKKSNVTEIGDDFLSLRNMKNNNNIYFIYIILSRRSINKYFINLLTRSFNNTLSLLYCIS